MTCDEKTSAYHLEQFRLEIAIVTPDSKPVKVFYSDFLLILT